MSFVLQSYLQFNVELKWDILLPLVFLATIVTYNLSRLTGLLKMLPEQKQYFWYGQREKGVGLVFILSSLVCLILFFYLSPAAQFGIALSGILTVLYMLPLFPQQEKRMRLREFGIAKIFLIAISWSLATVLVPALHIGFELNKPIVWYLLLERALFVFAITLPFDIRDMQVDRELKLKTIPLIIGESKTLQLAFGLLCLLTWMNTVYWGYFQVRPGVWWALLCSYVTTWILIRKSSILQKDQFYTGWVDGTMFLQFLLILIFESRVF